MRDAGDSFDAFVAARYAALLRTAFLLTGHRQEAEDLVQETLIKAAKVWRRIEHGPEAYVRKTMYHESVSRWRRRRHREIHVAQVPERSDAPRESVASRVTLQRALARLTPHQRAVLVLRYYEDLTERQTADALGVAVGTVKSQTRHALKRLRELAPELADFGPVAPGQRVGDAQ